MPEDRDLLKKNPPPTHKSRRSRTTTRNDETLIEKGLLGCACGIPTQSCSTSRSGSFSPPSWGT